MWENGINIMEYNETVFYAAGDLSKLLVFFCWFFAGEDEMTFISSQVVGWKTEHDHGLRSWIVMYRFGGGLSKSDAETEEMDRRRLSQISNTAIGRAVKKERKKEEEAEEEAAAAKSAIPPTHPLNPAQNIHKHLHHLTQTLSISIPPTNQPSKEKAAPHLPPSLTHPAINI